jgi:hypothetical protein
MKPLPEFNILAYIRRLSKKDWTLYVRFDRDDVARCELRDGDEVELNVGGKVTLRGVVRTTGAGPWLAPREGGSNESITQSLKYVGYTDGDDMPSYVTRVHSAA